MTHLRFDLRLHRVQALVCIVMWIAVWSVTSTDLAFGQASPRPNIVLVMCDDLGYGDPQCFNPDSVIQTPNLDQMAADGLKFTRFYAAAPVCSPTRGSCLTGRHPFRYGIEFANSGHLPKDETTLPEILKRHGYATGHFGKWHLGTLTKTVLDANRGGPRGAQHFSPPRFHGYDESFVTESKVPTYDPMRKPKNPGKVGWDYLKSPESADFYGTRYWDHDGKEVTKNLAGDDSRVIMDRVIPFIETSVNQEQPFFAVVWFHAPHYPVVAGPEHVAPYQHHDMNKRNYFGCVSAMDQQVGRLREAIAKLGVDDDTMLWLCSDNGPEGNSKSAGSAGPLRGRKRSLYEGGVRVPGILVWPGHAKPGSETNFAACTSDYLPTIADAIGANVPTDRPLDGISLMDAVAGRKKSRVAPLGFQSRSQAAWHVGPLKLITQDSGKTWELYDLDEDPQEKNNLAQDRPADLQRMREDLLAWQASCQVE